MISDSASGLMTNMAEPASIPEKANPLARIQTAFHVLNADGMRGEHLHYGAHCPQMPTQQILCACLLGAA